MVRATSLSFTCAKERILFEMTKYFKKKLAFETQKIAYNKNKV